ncbi:MAG TPA: hypothetical protein VM261_18100 [Kofleriaceae bacterium]|nr:hypothetical protein [Kofleriaceae bacterium]
MRRCVVLLAIALGACGDNLPQVNELEIVGHSDLGARGMFAAIAVAGDIAYVGSRNDKKGVLIVDLSDPKAPAVVGEIGPPDAALPRMSPRELRVVPDLNLLVVLNMVCGDEQHGCASTGVAEPENLRFFDISNRRAPVALSTVTIAGDGIRTARSPHEFFLWRDGARVLVFIAAPPGPPSVEVLDATDPRNVVRAAQWEPTREGVVKLSDDYNIHSVGVSPDGNTMYVSHLKAGLLLADVSDLANVHLITPPPQALTWPPLSSKGPHSAVPLVGREHILVLTEEVYPVPLGPGCPWGYLRTADVSDPTRPVLLGEFKIPENDPSYCANVAIDAKLAFTAHNVTATKNLAFVTWYAGGLHVVDVSDPALPVGIAELRPTPVPNVEYEDPTLGAHPVSMWSYPVIQDKLIYVIDSRNGLYVLEYHGKFEDELAADVFNEGNSNR